jgi:omega-6 fatty acid desaturase (delta-12 desaturase)
MNTFNKEQMMEDLKNWNSMLKKYQIPRTRTAILQLANSFTFYLGLLALQFYLFDKSVIASVTLAILNGFLLGRIFIIQHDCGHRSFTKYQTLNDIIGTVCSLCTVIPYKYWAKSHNFHHAHNGQLEYSDIGDIECLTTDQYSALSLKQKIWYRIYRNPFYLFTIGGFIYVVLYNRFAFLKEAQFQKVRKSVTLSNVLFVSTYTAFAWLLGPSRFLIVQFANLLFFGAYALWFFYIQHQYEHIYKSGKDNWNYVVAAIKGSTYYKLPSFFHWLTGNIGYHHIHHLAPTIPNYFLPRVNRENPIFEKHAQVITFWQSLKTVQANLWDAQRQKMVSFGEYRRLRKANQV